MERDDERIMPARDFLGPAGHQPVGVAPGDHELGDPLEGDEGEDGRVEPNHRLSIAW